MTARMILALWAAVLTGCNAPVKDPAADDGRTPTFEPATTPTTCDIITDGPVWFQDQDGDCSLGAADCDDLDPTVHPGGWSEMDCDGKDNDCNGLIDDSSAARVWYLDLDNDGWAALDLVHSCSMPAPYVEYEQGVVEQGDCDDSDFFVHPDWPNNDARTGIDVPVDGIDQDCDGADACAPVCAGNDCGIVGDAASTDFCEQWGQTLSFEIDPDVLGELDIYAVDCLCVPSPEVVVDAWEVASISGVEDRVSPTGRLYVSAQGGDLRDFDAFAGRIEFLGDIEIITPYGQGCPVSSLSGLRDMVRLGSLQMYSPGGTNAYQGTDLADLSKLTTVDRDLWVGGALTSLHGLEGLTEVGGGFDVMNAPDLASLEALTSLRRVGGLGIEPDVLDWEPGDPKLSISGLESLEEVDGWVSIGVGVEDYSPLSNLVRVTGALNLVGDGACPILPSLAYVGGLDLSQFTTCDLSWLTFATSFSEGLSLWNTGISSLAGLENVTSVAASAGRRFSVGSNPDLESLEGLAGLVVVNGSMKLVDNDSLATLTGLENLTTIEGDLEISGNDRLTQLDALYGLEWVAGDIRIEDNASLTEEEIYAFLDNLGRENIGLSVYVSAVR